MSRKAFRFHFDRECAANLPGVIYDLGKELEIEACSIRAAAGHDHYGHVEAAASRVEEIGKRIKLKWVALNEYMNAALERIEAHETSAVGRQEAAERARDTYAAKLQSDNLQTSFVPHGYFVYLLLGSDDRPVYVGQSSNILSRLGQHMGMRQKRELTDRVQLIRCASKSVMDRTESALIAEHQPPLNVRGIR